MKSHSTGKRYFELTKLTGAISGFAGGITKSLPAAAINEQVGGNANGWAMLGSGNKLNSGSNVSYGAALAVNDVVGFAVNFDTGKIWAAKNNVWQASGNPVTEANPMFTTVNGTCIAAWSIYTNPSTGIGSFKATNFIYTPPTGFLGWDD